jgi:crotonobetainyl-CoA:carnitine CoA-transferase CaiB-like acyl-CoA transferase
VADDVAGVIPAHAPLRGVRVLDLSRVLAGPWAGQALADLGADVLKVERPGAGDDTRAWGPPWHVAPDGAETSAYFQSCNRGKASLAVDLASEEGAERVLALARAADVVLENFKPGALLRFGLDPVQLRAACPRLVVCSITGFGQTGPWRDRAGYDLMIQGMGGLMSLGGEPGGPPMKTGVAVADLMTGMYAATAVLAALVRRGATGEGCHIDLALFDTQLAWLANQGLNALVSGRDPRRWGNAHPNLVPYEVFQAADGWFCLAVGNDAQFRTLCGLLGQPAWADDPRFATNAARVAHRDTLVPAVGALLAREPRERWLDLLRASGIPAGPIWTVTEALGSPQAQARGAVRVHEDEVHGRVQTLAWPAAFDGVRPSSGAAPPRLGEGGEQVAARWLRG